MTHRNIKSRTAMTAIAAVVAISSTPLLAQDASVPDPVADTTTETPVAVTPDPLAPDPAATTVAAPETAPTKAAETSKASTAKPAPAARRSTSTARSTPNRVADAAPAAPAVPTAAQAGEAPAEVPLPIAEAAPPVAEPTAPLEAEAAPSAQSDMLEDVAPVAGAAGLGLFLLAGAGLAVRRRRRLDREEFETKQWALDHPDVGTVPDSANVEPEPVFARTPSPVHDAVPAAAVPATALPSGFDISRFGRHVQAADRGPTPDNPSLSLKNRLRKASFFDQQERRTAQATESTATPAAQPAWATRKANEAEFMFRPATRKPAPKPVFEK